MTPAFKSHVDAIRSGAVTKTNVVGLRKALSAIKRHYYTGRDPYRSASVSEVDQTLSLVDDVQPLVEGALHVSGLKVLRNPRYAKRFTSTQREIIESAFARFRFCGFDQIGGTFVPIYRVEDARTGDGFRFTNQPWQSGGNGPEVL